MVYRKNLFPVVSDEGLTETHKKGSLLENKSAPGFVTLIGVR